ncbi:MAG TPA: NRDE family protein [Steroidobacteraceae bacterium]|nr:NRDE family protein [Steroidobacteraceae bacterium]
MCLLVLAWEAHPRYRLIVAANRDEYHERPAAPLGKWALPDAILAGRDLRAGGTWLGIDRGRRFGVVTNFRELQRPLPEAPSRGGLVPAYLRGTVGAGAYLAALQPTAQAYSGFNLLLADERSLWYASNRAPNFARALEPGVYGLSNEFLDTPWPKLQRVRRRFDAWLAAPSPAPATELFEILADPTRAGAGEQLPRTGLSHEWEQVLSSAFVIHPQYGTRCSTVLLLEDSGAFCIAERRFDSSGAVNGETALSVEAGSWP